MRVRSPAVAGMFYPGEAAALRRAVEDAFAQAQEAQPRRPKALIVPHAGYVYSGPVAASAYALLAPLRESIRRVVLLGPAHRVWVAGLALPGVDAFATPFGNVLLDRAAVAEIADLPQVEISPQAHALEHSLEVHLPFLQSVLADFRLVPLVVGDARAEAVAEVLDRLWGGDETLIVVSTDLSHYLPYAEARRVDEATVQAVLRLDPNLHGVQACGARPLNGLLLAARRHDLAIHLLDLRNSGDTSGERASVVGYGAFALTRREAEPDHVR